jgi:hypothetical protein
MFSRRKKSFWGRDKAPPPPEKAAYAPAVTVTEVRGSPPRYTRGYQSMSAADDKQAYAIRHDAFALMSNTPLFSEDGFWTAKNSSRQSLDMAGRRTVSSPYAATQGQMASKPTHRRTFSASATALPLRGETQPAIISPTRPAVPSRRSSAGITLPPPIPPKLPITQTTMGKSPSSSTAAHPGVSVHVQPIPPPQVSVPHTDARPPTRRSTDEPRPPTRRSTDESRPTTRRAFLLYPAQASAARSAEDLGRSPAVVKDDRNALPSQKYSPPLDQRPIRPPITALRAAEIHTGAVNEAMPFHKGPGLVDQLPARPPITVLRAPEVRSGTINDALPQRGFHPVGQVPSRPSITALRAPEVQTGAINEARPAVSKSGYAFERPATIEAAARLAAASQGRSVTYTEGSVRAAFQGLHLEEQRRSASWSNMPKDIPQEELPPLEPIRTTRPHMNPRQALFSHPWRPHRIARRREWKVDELFQTIPGEVLELILHELSNLHLASNSSSCATCWMRDCCSLALVCRRWSKFAKVAL